jgi:hypothetical protein
MNPDVCWAAEVKPLDPRAFVRWQGESRELESLQIVFIVGPQRTGTTWLSEALGRHPGVASLYEGHFASNLLTKLVALTESFNAATIDANKANPRHTAHLLVDDADALALARQALDRQLLRYARTHDRARGPLLALVDKSPNDSRHVGLLAALYPWAKFVCCLRDVRDAAVSMWRLDEWMGVRRHPDIESMARWYAEHVYGADIKAARAAGRSLGPSRYAEVWYEAHKADPRTELVRLLAFIGLPASDAIVESILSQTDFKTLSGGRAPGQEGGGIFRKGVVGEWKEHLSPRLADELLDLAGLPELRTGLAAAAR